MDGIVNFLQDIPEELWGALLAGTGVSALLQGLKNWLNVQSTFVLMALLGSLSFIGACIEFIGSASEQDAMVLGQYTAVIVGVSQYAYRFVVSPLQGLVNDARSYRAQGEERIGGALTSVTGSDEPVDVNVVDEPDTIELSDTIPGNEDFTEEFLEDEENSISNEGQSEPIPIEVKDV